MHIRHGSLVFTFPLHRQIMCLFAPPFYVACLYTRLRRIQRVECVYELMGCSRHASRRLETSQ